jgi:hypothetical protein
MDAVWDVILPDFDLPQPARVLSFGTRRDAVRGLQRAGFRAVRAAPFPLQLMGSHRYGRASRFRSGDGIDVLVLPRLSGAVVMPSCGDAVSYA